MEFRRQLVIGHVALLIIFVVTGAVSAVALRIACDQLDGVARDLSADTLATQQLRRQAEQLVANALKFTPRGGRIAVTGRRDGPVVRFEVADTGPGISGSRCRR
jgi:signal transduction histidine kinase